MRCSYCGSNRHTVENCPKTWSGSSARLHLRRKLAVRDPSRLADLRADINPLFYVVPGPVEPWERVV
jgi:hypothetical protein